MIHTKINFMKSITNFIIVLGTSIALILCISFKIAGQKNILSESDKLDALISKYNSLNRFNGVVLVAKDGNKILSKGYGYASLEWNIPNTDDTKYLIASISKTFTATLITKLIDEGKLTFETKLSEALPWYREDVGEKVSIFQLLNHTSGIPNYMDMRKQTRLALNREFGTEVIDKIAFAKKYCSSDLEFVPGTKWNYNNSAYFLLGLIVEQITSKPFDVYLQETIFMPLKMEHSGDLQSNPDAIIENLATGYVRTEGGYSHMPYWNLSTAFGAGTLYSTIDDLLKFDRAFYNDSFISSRSKQAMFTAGLNGYGCGWEIRENPIGPKSEIKKIITHEGYLWAWHTRIYRIPEDGYCIIIISNTGDSPLEKMFAGLTDILYGRQPEFPKPSLCAAIQEKYKTEGIEKAIEYGKMSLIDKPEAWEIKESELNLMGYQLLNSNHKDDAIKIFKWNTELHPQSWNAWDSYGEGLYYIGYKKEAIEAYKKSLTLNPENKSGAEMLNKLLSK